MSSHLTRLGIPFKASHPLSALPIQARVLHHVEQVKGMWAQSAPCSTRHGVRLQVLSAIVARRASISGLPGAAGGPSEASVEAAQLLAGRLDELAHRMADRADVTAILARLQVG